MAHTMSLHEQMNRPKEIGGVMKVSNEALYNSLISDPGPAMTSPTSEQVGTAFMKKERRREAAARALEDTVVRNKRFMQHQETADRQMMENSRLVKEKIAVESRKREDNFRNLKNDLAAGLVLAAKVGRYLNLHEEAELVKKKKLYETWNEEIYGTINNKVRVNWAAREKAERS